MEQVFQRLDKIYIVGAGSRAKTLTGYLLHLYPDVSVLAYLVDTLDGNDSKINGVVVQKLEGNTTLYTEYPVLIATKGIYHEDIHRQLCLLGFSDILPVTVNVDNFLRNKYVRSVFNADGRVFRKIEDLACDKVSSGNDNDLIKRKAQPDITSARIYMAKSIYDKALQSKYQRPYYETAIQVGASLTEHKLEDCEYQDDIGENISHKNRQYCELTAIYWIWKNASEKIVGLSHYRRHFVLPEDWQARMQESHVDVILPVPACVQPSIEENYRERHDAGDLDEMFSFLKQRDVEDYRIAREVFAGNLYYPCNMFIVKKEVLNELCKWLFPVLDYVVQKCGVKEDVYLNRYPGFLSERLVTVFFTKNKAKYRIILADKNFIS